MPIIILCLKFISSLFYLCIISYVITLYLERNCYRGKKDRIKVKWDDVTTDTFIKI